MQRRRHILFGVWLLASLLVDEVSSHGRLIEPPSRASMWRYGFNTPPDYNDNQSYCGGFTHQYQRNNGKCGICGDAWDLKPVSISMLYLLIIARRIHCALPFFDILCYCLHDSFFFLSCVIKPEGQECAMDEKVVRELSRICVLSCIDVVDFEMFDAGVYLKIGQ